MAVLLEGGCWVSHWREAEPVRDGTLGVFPQIGRAVGAQAISLRILELAPGTSPTIRTAQCDEVLYVLEGEGRILLDGFQHHVSPDTGFYVRPGSSLVLSNPGPEPVILVSSRCPEPEDVIGLSTGSSLMQGRARVRAQSPLVRLSERRSQVTADRWYRVLIDDEIGSEQVTQFVGGIPPGRAPDHFHLYEEVLFILAGTGRMWAGQSNTPIGPGSCIYLPRRQVHCVENCGTGELRLLGVFYPSGSPAVRYESGSSSALPTSTAS